MSDVAVSVLSDIACMLGEGPAYDARTDTLFWFDILQRKLFEKPLSGMETVVHDLPVMASALADVDERRQAGAIYWFFKGEVRRLFSHITVPNSICFSPDGTIGYFSDTHENRLYRVACDPETGRPVDDPVLTIEGRERSGSMDGSVVDAEGILWNARWGGGRIDAWSPRGELIRSVPMPARQISCPVFIGREANRLAATSAYEGMDEDERKADPQAGKLFLLDLEINGRLDPPVLL
ncbi:SMP-30/gluconolactonase/LRE family protein [Chelativorans sp. J32]|uniref:SMP-30/gluconolactonase/LRE family protein n=1 Tax=Chelativorans sp. J32 TaxID=935840 RepID=UPI000486CF35|nr:SMP-30/gluconolactonase/LRE family protein [Chelativorans sp. J32]